MNRAAVQIQIGPNLADLIDRYSGSEFTGRISDGIRYGLDLANQVVVGRVKVRRLTGKGPFPVSQNKLGHRKRDLIKKFDTNRAEIRDRDRMIVGSSMGTNLEYFGAHEFGFSGAVKVRAHTRENGQKVRAHTRDVKIPERKMVRTELAQMIVKDIYQYEITKAVIERLENT